MREEVLNQHSRETRAAAAAPTNQAVPSSINSEFLNALPPELRAEVLAQEAMEAARIRAATAAPAAPDGPEGTSSAGGSGAAGNAGAGAAAPAEPMEMDPVAFLASLDPHLRQTVLLEQGEEMLGALPPDMLEE
jgi:E3 ubiquitin-protein ligase HUWE1